MKNNTDNANEDMNLTVKNAWYFNFLWDQGMHMFFWKEKQKFCIIPPGITGSTATIEVLEQGMKYVQSQEERPQNNIIDIVLQPQLLTLNMFYTFFYCFDCWHGACNVGKNCKNFLYCCEIKLIEQLKL